MTEVLQKTSDPRAARDRSELKDDALKLCYAEADSDKERPTEFKTLKKSRLMLVEMKREKK